MIYQIYMDDLLVYSSDSPDQKYGAIGPTLSQDLNVPDELIFSKPEDLIINRKSIYRVLQDGVEISRGRPKSSSMAFNKVTKVTCEGQMAFFQDSVQPLHEYQNVTTSQFLTALLTSHNSQVEGYKKFQLGTVGINVTLDTYTNFESTYDALCQLVTDHGGFFRFRKPASGNTYYLDYLAYTGGGDATQEVRFGENLLDFSRNTNLGSIYTAIVPLGARLDTMSTGDGPEERLNIAGVNSGSVAIQNTALVNTYGLITKTKVYDEITNATTLKNAGNRDLTNQFEDMSLNVKFLDLHLTDSDIPSFVLGNQVHVISKPHDLDKNFVITQLTIEMDNPAGSKITLGRSGGSKITTTAGQSVATALKVANKSVTRTGVVAAAQQLANEMFSTDGTGSYVIFDTDSDNVVQQIIVMDSPDASLATKKLVINKNGIGGSGDGGSTYTTALTTDGWIYGDRIIAGTINGDRIIAGTINGDRIIAGTLSSEQVRVAINNIGNTIVLNPSSLEFKDNGKLVSQISNSGMTYYDNGVRRANFYSNSSGFQMGLFPPTGTFEIIKWENEAGSTGQVVFQLAPSVDPDMNMDLNMFSDGRISAGVVTTFNRYECQGYSGKSQTVTINNTKLNFVGGILTNVS